MKRVRVVARRAGSTRDEKLQGIACRVFPVVMVQEQVLTNNLGATFLPAEEIQASVEAWNGMPVVIRHPMYRGMPVSARHPDVLNQRGVGRVFNARFEAGALKADVFVELARIAEVEGTDIVVNAAEDGEPAELSTGFNAMIEEAPGTHDGKKYDLVLRGIQPDHLALLPDEIGACSVSDGCGFGANVSVTTQAPAPEKKMGDKLMALLRRMAGMADNESDEDKRMRLWDALAGQFGGSNRALWIDSVFSAERQIVFHLETLTGASLLRTEYSEAEDGTITFSEPMEVRRVTVFEPVANEAGQTTQKESFMNRQQMIAHLVANGRTEASITGLTDCDLQALCNTVRPAAAAPAANGAPVVPAVTQPGDGWEAYRVEREAREALERSTQNARASEAREREELLADVLFVRNRAWSDAEIKAMPITELRKLHRTLCAKAPSYAGQGGPRSAAGGATVDFVRGVMDGFEGESVLDPKRGN